MWAKPTGLWHDDSGRCVGYTERREPSPCSHAACNLRLWAVYSLASFSVYGKASRLASFPAAHGNLVNEATCATAQAAAFHYYRNSCSPYRPSPTDTSSSMDGTGNGEVLSILRSLQQQVSVLQAQQGLHSNSDSSNTTPQRETRDKETPRKRLPKELVVRALYTYIMLGLTYL